MKQALISPNEVTGQQGWRIAEVASVAFEVARPLFWIDCPDDVTASTHYFDPITDAFVALPQAAPVVTAVLAQPATTGTLEL